MTSSHPNYPPKAPSPNTDTLGVRASTCEFGGMQTFSPRQEGIFRGTAGAQLGAYCVPSTCWLPHFPGLFVLIHAERRGFLSSSYTQRN